MNDFRRQAIERIQVVADLDEAARRTSTARRPAPPAGRGHRRPPARPSAVGYRRCVRQLDGGPLLLVLGTGWGLTDELLAGCDAPPGAGRRRRRLQPSVGAFRLCDYP